MKTLIALFLTCIGVSAATPSFSSFNTNQFSTNNLFISIKDGAVITNLNVITDLFINSTNIVNLFAPSSVTNSGDSLWFDVASAATLTNTMESMVFFHDLLAGDDDSIALDYFVTTDQNFTNYAGLYAPFSSTSSSIQSYTIFGNGGPTEENRVQLSTDATSASIQMLFNGVLTDGFNVATPSGYTGAGTLFLSDDGTYKAAGGVGDTIWTNITGYVTMVPGQTETNTLAFTSGAADNATNILWKVDSANYISASGSLLASFRNAGTNQNRIDPVGGIHIGPNSTPYLGFYSLTERRDRATEANTGSGIQLEIYDSGDGNVIDQAGFLLDENYIQGYFRTAADATDVQLLEWELYSGNAIIRMEDQNVERWKMHPTVASSGSAIAYKFDTSNTLTNGDTFVSIRNAGTELLGIKPTTTGNASIAFGPGNTNSLTRVDSDLEYTNATTGAMYFTLRKETTGKVAKFGMTSGGVATVLAATSVGVNIAPDNGAVNYFFTNGSLSPSAAGQTLGATTSGNQFDKLHLGSSTPRVVWNGSTNTVFDTAGASTPEGSISSDPGSVMRTYSGDLLVKRTGTGNTGWDSVFTIEQGFAASDETTALTTTTNAVRVQLPYNMTLTGVYASLTTVQTAGSTLTIDLKESGTSVLSTLLTIDNDELGSDTAAAPAVISDSTIAKYAPLVFSITQVGTSPAGLKVWIIGRRAP